MNFPIFVSISKILKGIRCIRAERDIKAGELIESCPVILIPIDQLDNLDKTIITNYNYDWDKENNALVLGYGSLYNHAFSANAHYQRNLETKMMEYIAIKDIKKNEEIFVNYNGKPDDNNPLEYDYHTDFKL